MSLWTLGVAVAVSAMTGALPISSIMFLILLYSARLVALARVPGSRCNRKGMDQGKVIEIDKKTALEHNKKALRCNLQNAGLVFHI